MPGAAITVTPATLTVTANSYSVAFGAADPTYAATITGLVNGDKVSLNDPASGTYATAQPGSGISDADAAL